jgi:hypothetical protein
MREMKRVSLTSEDRQYLIKKIARLESKYPEVLDRSHDRYLFKVYQVILKVKYLTQIMQPFDIESRRVKRYLDELEELVSDDINIYGQGLEFCNYHLSKKSGLSVTLKKDGQEIQLFISDAELMRL